MQGSYHPQTCVCDFFCMTITAISLSKIYFHNITKSTYFCYHQTVLAGNIVPEQNTAESKNFHKRVINDTVVPKTLMMDNRWYSKEYHATTWIYRWDLEESQNTCHVPYANMPTLSCSAKCYMCPNDWAMVTSLGFTDDTPQSSQHGGRHCMLHIHNWIWSASRGSLQRTQSLCGLAVVLPLATLTKCCSRSHDSGRASAALAERFLFCSLLLTRLEPESASSNLWASPVRNFKWDSTGAAWPLSPSLSSIDNVGISCCCVNFPKKDGVPPLHGLNPGRVVATELIG